MKIHYAEIEKAVSARRPGVYAMSFLRSSEACCCVVEAVNRGIDARLEACLVPDRGDSQRTEQTVVGERLHLTFSAASLPVLLRRLLELANADAGRAVDGDCADKSDSVPGVFAVDVLQSLGLARDLDLDWFDIEVVSPADEVTHGEEEEATAGDRGER